jgi:hypothetical protein
MLISFAGIGIRFKLCTGAAQLSGRCEESLMFVSGVAHLASAEDVYNGYRIPKDVVTLGK